VDTLTELDLDLNLQVEKIQLEVGSNSTTLMASDRKLQGSDTLHLTKQTEIRRDFTDI